MPFHELDTVVLCQDLPAYGLRKEDLGAVVAVYGGGTAYEVEFVAGSGRTVALLTLPPESIRSMHPDEIPSVRRLPAAA